MKKLFVLLFVLIIAVPTFAQLKSNQVVGDWKYTVVTDEAELTGVFKFVEKDGKLTGEVVTSESYTIPFTKIELKEANTLYLELRTESDIIKVSVKVDKKTFKGTGSSSQGEAPISGVKME